MSEYKNNSELIGLVSKWWKPLIGVSLLAFILAVVFSSPFVITPKFKSFAVLYPANIIPMGTETPTEQMLQVLESDNIRDSIVSLYHLYHAYDIDSTNTGSKARMIKEYENHITFQKTEFESVIIDVLDENPVQAKEMVNSIISFFNKKERSLQKEKSLELSKILGEQVSKKRAEMDSMEAVLAGIRRDYGILDYGLQTEYATERYLEVVSSAKRGNVKEIEVLLEALKDKGGDFISVGEHLWRVRGSYNNLKEQLEAAIRDVEKDLTYCNIITNPVVADKKSYPIRWLIVLVSVCASLLLSVLVLSLLENQRNTSNQ